MARALASEVSTWPDESPQLIGSRCGACGATTWPRQSHCPRCSGPDMSELLLPRRGTLVAWTTQGFVPKLPYAGDETAATFEPFVTFGQSLRDTAAEEWPRPRCDERNAAVERETIEDGHGQESEVRSQKSVGSRQ